MNVALWVAVVICRRRLKKANNDIENIVDNQDNLPQKLERMSRAATPARSPSQLGLMDDEDGEIRFVEVAAKPKKLSHEDSRRWLREDHTEKARGEYNEFEISLPSSLRRASGSNQWLARPGVYYQQRH